MLETNQTPAIRVSNRVNYIDPAMLRRFDYVLEVPVPPLRARERIVRNYVYKLNIPGETIKAIARNERLTPADIERASKIVAFASADVNSGSKSTCEALVRVINNSMIARGKPLVSLAAASVSMGEYRHDAVNCDQNLGDLARALKTRPQARLCLYGAPGTGKTAFVKHLADASGAPLVQKKASDLLSARVGDTEDNIACMFHEARRQRAILLLDEADSFLQDRHHAQHSWEITIGTAITPESLLEELKSEASYKPGFKQHPVGFV